MAFHPYYWDKAVRNGSSEYNQYEWNRVGRKTAAQFTKVDTRKTHAPRNPSSWTPKSA
jgi:hypothetical protein